MRPRHALLAGTLAAALLVGTGAAAAEEASLDARFDTFIGDAKAAMLADPNVAISKAVAARRLADREPSADRRATMQATAAWLRGEAYARLNDMETAQPIIANALAQVARAAPNSKLHADLLLSSGGIATALANVSQALSDYQAAHAIYVKLGDVRSQAKALQAIGALYGGGNDYLSALKYYDQALAVYKADPNILLSLYNNRGNALRELERFPEADRQYRDALALATQVQSTLSQVVILGNIAETRLAVGDVDGADRVIASGLKLSSRNEAAGYRKWLYAIAARAAYQRHDLPRAAALIAQRFAGEDFAKAELLDREAHQTAFDIYRAMGRNDLALAHLTTLKRLDDEATKLARSTNAALMAARFDFANQELKIAKLRQDELQRNVAYEQDRARTQRQVFLGAAGGAMIVMALLLFALFTSRKARERVQAANADLASTNDALGKALAAKTEFLATTSHEIRTPLNGILGMTQVMLTDTGMREETRDRLKVVHGAGITMRALVDDILDVAKMETGNLTIEDAPFDLKTTMTDSTRLWEDQATAKGLRFVRDLADSPGMIRGDPARMRQIVFNLLSNAVKFTPQGSVTLTVRAAGERVRIVVTDTGVGIPAHAHEAIFESFRQADTSTTRQFGGTGLGLAICRRLARAMGGDVTVESEEGRGATFTVDLPLAAAAERGSANAAADAAPALLIVERNPIARAMLKTLLGPSAGCVETTGSVAEAIGRVERGRIARVLLDDGALAGEDDPQDAVRRLVTAAGPAPVTVLWAKPSDAERHALLIEGGATAVIAKPVSGAQLVAAMFPADPHEPLVTRAA